MASQHVGEVGKRIAFSATCTGHTTYDRKRFGQPLLKETVHVTVMKDGDGNLFVVFSPAFSAVVGDTFTVRGTVSEHREFNGEKQTVLKRAAKIGAAP